MATESRVEERLSAVERAVDELQNQLRRLSGPSDWVERITGSFKDEPAFAKVLEYGRDIQSSDRASTMLAEPASSRFWAVSPAIGGEMRSFTFVIERDPETGLLVGYVPGWPGAHSQGADEDELRQNLEEVIALLLEDGEPVLESEFVSVQTVQVA